VLEQLDKIDGVEASSANHTGTMLRIAVRAGTDREKVAEVVHKRLAGDDRQPIRIEGDKLKAALAKERWRTKEQVGELTAIEFRKLALDRIKDFLQREKVADDATSKLREIAEALWDRLAQQAEMTAPKQLPHKIDWKRRCRDFAAAFTDIEETKVLLTADQQQRFKQLVESCFSRLPNPAK
jgi:predicted polyphosphate/ATP-dependent NAD kinase